MTVKELYSFFEDRIPSSLSEEWDNDGLMCSPDTSKEVKRALVTLDVTEDIVDYAIESGFDLIVSHHPLIFKPISSLTDSTSVARKLIKLLGAEISVFSFHTRADKVEGGVNDCLCDLLDIFDPKPFGEGGLGRIGCVEQQSFEDFTYRVKQQTGADVVKYSDGLNPVSIVAVVGGDGKDFVKDAILAGADTFISGRISYNLMEEAAELGINMIEAGHYFTEQPVTEFFRKILLDSYPDLYVEVASSNTIKFL